MILLPALQKGLIRQQGCPEGTGHPLLDIFYMYLSGIKESYLPDKNFVPGQFPDGFDKVIVSIDDGELMLFIVEGGGTFLNDGIPVHIQSQRFVSSVYRREMAAS